MSANDRLRFVRRSGLWATGLPLAAAMMLMLTNARADVTVYEEAPSVEELQQKLLGGTKAEQRKYKTRSIVFGDAPAEAASAQQPTAQAPAIPAQSAAAPAAAASHQPQSVQVSDNAIAFPIQFKLNSAQILPEALPFLQSIAGLMQKDSGIRLLIEGHTDISGSPQRNLALSRERAFAVMHHLIDRFGIDPMRFMPVGKGPAEPLNDLDPSDPRNRRVQFRIIG